MPILAESGQDRSLSRARPSPLLSIFACRARDATAEDAAVSVDRDDRFSVGIPRICIHEDRSPRAGSYGATARSQRRDVTNVFGIRHAGGIDSPPARQRYVASLMPFAIRAATKRISSGFPDGVSGQPSPIGSKLRASDRRPINIAAT